MKQHQNPSTKPSQIDAAPVKKSFAPMPFQLQASESEKAAQSAVPQDQEAAAPIVGKAAIVPKNANGTNGAPVPLYQLQGGKMEATPAFVALASGDPAAAKLLTALNLAIGVQFAREGLADKGMQGLEYWLTSPEAIPTMIVLSSMLEPKSPADRQKEGIGPESVSAATMYNTETAGPYSNTINWSNRGTLDADYQEKSAEDKENCHDWIKPVVKTAMDTESKGIPVRGKNLMLFDREEIMSLSDAELAGVVFHEFFVHLSVPESYKFDTYRQKSSLNTDAQHTEEFEYHWDAKFARELNP